MRVSIEKLRQRGARTEKEYTDELEQHGRDCGGHIAGLNWRWRWWNRWFHDGVGCRLHVGPFFLRHFFTLTYRLEVHYPSLPHLPLYFEPTFSSLGRAMTFSQVWKPMTASFTSLLPGNGGRTDARRAACGAHRYAAAATCAHVTLQPQAATAAMARGRHRAAGGGRGFEEAVA